MAKTGILKDGIVRKLDKIIKEMFSVDFGLRITEQNIYREIAYRWRHIIDN